MGIFAMLAFLMLILYFLFLSGLLAGQIYRSIREKFKDKQRLVLIGVLTSVLALAFFYPNGLINFNELESDSVLVAQREGAANCMTTLKLKESGKFIERSVCFGVTETTGEYRVVGDTIYFENVDLGRDGSGFYEFAVIENENKKEKHLGDLVRFKNHSDTTGAPLWITKNELKKQGSALQKR